VTEPFDFVVVGGGSGDCAVSGQLSEGPKTSVALLDAGGWNDNRVVTTPFAPVPMVAITRHRVSLSARPMTGSGG